MRNRLLLVLGGSLLAGGLAAYLAFGFLRTPAGEEGAEGTAETTPAAVAARDLPVGTIVSREEVRLVDWPAGSLPEGYASSPSEVVGRGLLAGVKTNEPFLSSKLARKEAGGGLPITIPKGRRALSVRVNDVINVAGYVSPGTRVDVLVTLDEGSSDDPATQIVLQNISVLSTGNQVQENQEGDPQNYTVATLLVTPEEAEKLTLASTRGQIQLALRNPLDLDTAATPGIRKANVLTLGGRERPVARNPRPAPRSRPSRVQVEIYRGPERSTSIVDTGNGGGG